MEKKKRPRPVFVLVGVLFSAKEYDDLRHAAAFTPDGTVGEAVREALLLSPKPYGNTNNPETITESEYMEKRDAE
jgi:hypothetical protein